MRTLINSHYNGQVVRVGDNLIKLDELVCLLAEAKKEFYAGINRRGEPTDSIEGIFNREGFYWTHRESGYANTLETEEVRLGDPNGQIIWAMSCIGGFKGELVSSYRDNCFTKDIKVWEKSRLGEVELRFGGGKDLVGFLDTIKTELDKVHQNVTPEYPIRGIVNKEIEEEAVPPREAEQYSCTLLSRLKESKELRFMHSLSIKGDLTLFRGNERLYSAKDSCPQCLLYESFFVGGLVIPNRPFF